jgi:hypothetical protein
MHININFNSGPNLFLGVLRFFTPMHYLFVEECVEDYQVEVSLQALHGPVEEIVFGAASLADVNRHTG